MKYLEKEVRRSGYKEPLAYYHGNWTRNGSPLLDELGAVLDHVEAFAFGGNCEEANLVTACCKCNGRKSVASPTAWNRREVRKAIQGKYGEPQHWDGLSTLFAALAEDHLDELTKDEREWLKALKLGFQDAPIQ